MRRHVELAIEYLEAILMRLDQDAPDPGMDLDRVQIEVSNALIERSRSRSARAQIFRGDNDTADRL